jgi:RNA polymerase sigma factor (sigma-70 family)
MVDRPSGTWVSLLGRLRHDPADQAAWGDLVDHYGRQVYRWCRHWGLQDADAQDVTQDVLVKLAAKLPAFAYDPARSFRGWLKTLARHACSDLSAGRKRAGAGSGDSDVRQQLESVEAAEDLVRRIEEAFDQEVLAAAEVQVRLRVAPHTWEAFHLLAREGLPAATVAERVGMQVAMVYVAKSKVLRMLQEEVRKLQGSDE